MILSKTVSINFEGIQFRDNLKREYAIAHGFDFLEIPYWTVEDGSYKSLIDSAIQQALSKQSEVAV